MGAWTRARAVTALAAALAAAFAASSSAVDPASAAGAQAEAARGGVFVKHETFRMSGADEKRRLVVRCPRNKVPFGGGMKASPPPGPDGEGVYPHSFERLGVQHGWHVTPVLYDPSAGNTTPRRVTLQVVCGPKLRHVTPPHTTVFVGPGQTKTIYATCPGRRRLFGGGFQRTDFVSRGGDYVNEARAITAKKWRVTGSAFGRFGGELTAIAYCRRSRKPLIKEVSASTSVPSGGLATAQTPSCPRGRRLVFGGFSTFPAGSTFIADGKITGNGAWAVSGYNAFGPAATLFAHGYCHKV